MVAPRTNTRRRRFIRRSAAAIIVAALAGAAAIGIRSVQPDDQVASPAAAVLKTATVETGHLAGNEQVDGSVVLSATTTVRHRIEGQLASTSAASNSSAASTAPDGGAATAGPATALVTESLVEPCPIAPTPSTTTTLDPADPTSTTTTIVDPSSTTSTTAATPIDDSTTSTTMPPAVDCPDASSTTVVDDTGTTLPAESEPSVPADDPTVRTAPQTGGGANPSSGATAASTPSTGSTRTTQKVTSVTGAGATVQPGDVLYTVDGDPVVLLIGSLPAWRTLSEDVDDGADVMQLEYSLVALGYSAADGVTVDAHWDATTTEMVEAWQTGMGQEPTGSIALGTVVFLPAAASVSSVTASVGDDVGEGDTILTLAAPTQQVVIDVPAELQPFVTNGLEVDLDGSTGTVSLLRTVQRDGAVVVQAVITPAAELTDRVSGSTISVGISTSTADGSSSGDVLLVPVEALASRLDGSYTVQVDHGDGSSSWIEVTLVGVDGGTVAIRSDDLAAGASVLLPV